MTQPPPDQQPTPGYPPYPPVYPPAPAPAKKGLSTGAIVAIVIGGVVALCCVLGFIGTLLQKDDNTSTAGQTKDNNVVAATTTQAAVAKPSPTPAAPAGPLSTFGPGVYEVGKDVKAGTYSCTADQDRSGYWERDKNAEGNFDSIIANDNVAEGTKTIVTVKAKEFFKVERMTCALR